MHELVIIKHDEVMCDSLQVADSFNKRHDNVLKSIESIIGGLLTFKETQNLYIKSSYTDKQSRGR